MSWGKYYRCWGYSRWPVDLIRVLGKPLIRRTLLRHKRMGAHSFITGPRHPEVEAQS